MDNNINDILDLFLSLECSLTKTEKLSKKNTFVLTVKTKVLYLISRTPNCSPKDLIAKLNIEKSNLALLCKSLVNEGLITFKKHDHDKRFIIYSLTPKGKKLLEVNINTLNENINCNLNINKNSETINKITQLNEMLKNDKGK